MKVHEFAEVGNSYAQTMDLAARDAHATALPWNSVPCVIWKRVPHWLMARHREKHDARGVYL